MALNGLVDQLLVQVMVLEEHHNSPLEIPDSSVPILILPPAGQMLIPINDEVSDSEDGRNQVIVEDQVEGYGQVESDEVRELGIEGEIFEEEEPWRG